ncbi:MAG: DUF3095 family protein [Campylobacterota bacterium]
MSNKDFYKDIKAVNSFSSIFENSNYKSVPSNWFVVATDVVDSTNQIAKGKYKEINIIAAMSIISILNIDKQLDIPFVFGGDGSFLLIPNDILKSTKQALIKVKNIAKQSYGLDLRIGIIPIVHIYRNNKEVLVFKYKVSNNSTQAMIKGGGLSFADKLLKKDKTYYIKDKENENFHIDLSGLECRWESVKTPKQENLTILIEALEPKYYLTILEDLENILGSNKIRKPVVSENLLLSFKNEDLDVEAAVMAKSKIMRFIIVQKLRLINLIGKILMDNKISNWGSYKNRIVSTIDNEKFDDILRMVVAVNKEQTAKLEKYLKLQYENGKLVYGIHKSQSSLMTCLIFQRHGKHVHFIDGSNGGYALASKHLKVLKNKNLKNKKKGVV